MSLDSPRAPLAAIVTLALAGAVLLAINLHQPLVRNALIYARSSENVIAHGYNPLPVVSSPELSYNKPIGFPWLSSPLVAALGSHRGLMLASFLGTVAFLFAVRAFGRALRLSGREQVYLLLLCGLTPIVSYQFWSAYPDSLFAALFLVVCILALRTVERPRIKNVAALSVTLLVSLFLKNHGLILVAGCALFFLWNRRHILSDEGGRWVGAAIVIGLGLVGSFALLARAGRNPLLRMAGEGSGVEHYGQGSWMGHVAGTWLLATFTILLNLHFALPLMVRGLRRESRSTSPLPLSLFLCFPLLYVVVLTPARDVFLNMRYFVPLLPFGGVLAILGWRSIGTTGRRLTATAFAVTAVLLIVLFNVAPANAALGESIPNFPFLDSLRLSQHRRQAALLRQINDNVEPGGVLYLMDVNYYGDAQHGVYERAGLIRADIQTRYVRARDFAPQEDAYYVLLSFHRPSNLQRYGTAVSLGRGLFRVERTRAGAGRPTPTAATTTTLPGEQVR